MERKFTQNWTFRTPLRTIEFKKGSMTIDAETLAAADAAGVLEPIKKEKADGDNRTPNESATGSTVNLKG